MTLVCYSEKKEENQLIKINYYDLKKFKLVRMHSIFNDIVLVVFDFDGTLVHLDVRWIDLKQELRNRFLERYEYATDFHGIYKHVDAVTQLYGRQARDLAMSIIENYERENVSNFKIIETTITLVKQLKSRKKTLAIFSCNTKNVIVSILKQLKLHEYFDVIISINDVTEIKPSPQGLYKIMAKCSASPNTTLFIGDKQTDIEAGCRAGVKSFLIQEITRV
jgi:HAD superfamily hydrolase (TIGR01509 family)